MIYQETMPAHDEKPLSSVDLESRLRPRAATMSLCRYTVPCSPIRKPTESPPTSPPSLILPPPGRLGSGIYRTSSFLSSFDERLASSAPSTTYVMKECDRTVADSIADRQTIPDFTLIEEEVTGSDFSISRGVFLPVTPDLVGLDDLAGPSPINGERNVSIETRVEEFGASPVLLSCLRDIARLPRN